MLRLLLPSRALLKLIDASVVYSCIEANRKWRSEEFPSRYIVKNSFGAVNKDQSN